MRECERCGRPLKRPRCSVCGYNSATAAVPSPVAGDRRPQGPSAGPSAQPSAPPASPGSWPPRGEPRRPSPTPSTAPSGTPRPPIEGRVVQVGTPRTVTRCTAAANSVAGLGAGLASAVPRAVGIALGILFSPLRLLLGLSLLGAAGRRNAPTTHEIEIQSFRLQTDSGATVDCVLRGENRSGEVALGDRVRVHGHRSWRSGGAINITRVHNLDTGTVVRPHVPCSIRYTMPLALMKLAVGCFILLLFLAMCGVIH
jgi:hypothetical protein